MITFEGAQLYNKIPSNIKNDSKKKGDEKSIYCAVCQINFQTKDAYDKHLKHSALHTGLDFDPEPTTDEAEDIQGDDKEKKLHKLFKGNSGVVGVVKTLSQERKGGPRENWRKPSTCVHCGQHFATQKACMNHHRREHPGRFSHHPSDRIICEICGASLAPGSANAHRNQHTHQRLYTCGTCGRQFTSSTVLRNHMVTHTGEKRFACNLCDKKFTQNGSLSLHHRTFHLKQPYPARNRNKRHTDGPKLDQLMQGKEE